MGMPRPWASLSDILKGPAPYGESAIPDSGEVRKSHGHTSIDGSLSGSIPLHPKNSKPGCSTLLPGPTNLDHNRPWAYRDRMKQDPGIKRLLTAYPEQAIQVVAPMLVPWGPPIDTVVVGQEIIPHQTGIGGFLDVALHFSFQDRSAVVVLVEHWSEERKVDMHRIARPWRKPGLFPSGFISGS